MHPISQNFIAALQSPVHTMRVHMHVLDTDFNTIAEFHDVGDHSDEPNDTIVDGNVDVDTTRLTRRTFTANLLNDDAVWTPGSDWAGMFYVNRLVRLYRGIDFGGGQVVETEHGAHVSAEELVPIGTFMIDHADVTVERNMSIVVLSGSDLWKKFGKSGFGHAATWNTGTAINSVITEIATAVGILNVNLDPLGARATIDKQLQKAFTVAEGDNRGEALATLCKDYGIDVYFDPLGTLTTQDFYAPGDRAVVYIYDPTDNNNLLTVKASYSDDNLYNSVLVRGTADKDAIVTARVRDTNLTSVPSVARLLERLLIYESDNISSASTALQVANQLFYEHVLINEDITLETLCNPAFEGNDVIKVVEDEFSQLNSEYRIRAFTVPMSTSRQTIRLLREIKLT